MFAILNIFTYICPEKITLFAMKRQLLPSYSRMLESMGEQIKLARLRRDLSSEQVAERAGIARGTLIKVEKGDDELGRKLQDAKWVVKERASKK